MIRLDGVSNELLLSEKLTELGAFEHLETYLVPKGNWPGIRFRTPRPVAKPINFKLFS